MATASVPEFQGEGRFGVIAPDRATGISSMGCTRQGSVPINTPRFSLREHGVPWQSDGEGRGTDFKVYLVPATP